MTIQRIIQEAINKNPLDLKEALTEELRSRIALALEAKMSDEEDDDSSEEDDDEEDMKEEAEQIDELKKSTLASYTRKAADSMANAAHGLGQKRSDADEVDRMTNRNMPNKYAARDQMKKALGADDASQRKDRDVIGKRMTGIAQATKRLSKD